MAGVVADSVIVAVEGRFAKYERDFDSLIKKTETGMAKLRRLTEKPISIGATGGGNGAEQEAAKVERASNRKITAARKEAETEEQKAARISAAVDRGIAARERDAQSAERSADRVKRAGDRALAARQTAALRNSSAMSTSGTMPAPTAPVDKINYLLRDQIDTQTRLNAAQAAGNREEATALRDQLTQFRLINQYRRAGLSELDATARAEERVADIARRRANRAAATPAAPTATGLTLGGVVSGIRTAATLGFAGYGAVQGAREYLELTDAYKQYNAQLKLATVESGNLAVAQTDALRIATETRSGLAETANLYATFQRNAAQLGLTQADAARATETVTKAFQISGATAAEASGGLRQFLQGLQSGTLRGEEFNSVVENAPRLAKLLADQLTNGNIGALRALATEGKITGVELKEALTNQRFTEQIDKEFRELPVTFDQAMTVLRNAATVTFGEFDQGGQFSTALANFITGGSAGFVDLAKAASDSGIEIRATFAGLSDVFEPLFAGAQSVFGGIRSEANYTRDAIANILGAYDSLQNVGTNIENRVTRIGNFLGFKQSALTPLSNTRGAFLGSFGQQTQTLQNRRTEAVLGARFGTNRPISSFLSGERDALGNRRNVTAPTTANKDLTKYTAINADLEKLKATASGKELATINKKIAKNNQIIGNLNQGVGLAAATAAASGGGRGRSGPSAATLAKRVAAAQAKQVRNDDAYNAEAERLNSDILSAKGKQAQSIEQTAQAAIDNANAELKERELKYQNQENEKKISDQQRLVLVGLAKQVRAQQILAANTEKAAALADQTLRIAADAQTNQADAIRAQLDATTSRAERERLQAQLLDKEYEARATKLANDLQDATQRGDIAGQLDAEGKIANLPAQKAADQFRNREDNKSPYQKYRDNLSSADSLSDEIDNIKIETLDRVADSLADATKNALGLSGALGDIVGQIIKIGIQRALIGPLADALFGKEGGGGGGLGSIISGAAKLFGGGRASGGDVSAGKLYKVNEMGVELFQPAMSGKIIPTGRVNANRGSSTIVQPQINVDARGAVMNDEFARSILARANQTAKAYATQGGIQGAQGSKAVLARQQTLGT